jgi:hypothetical protein
MLGCQFYCLDEKGKDHLIGLLPERRVNPERISRRSIMSLEGRVPKIEAKNSN